MLLEHSFKLQSSAGTGGRRNNKMQDSALQFLQIKVISFWQGFDAEMLPRSW